MTQMNNHEWFLSYSWQQNLPIPNVFITPFNDPLDFTEQVSNMCKNGEYPDALEWIMNAYHDHKG